MSGELLLIWLIVGGVAGWLAGMIVKGGGFGLIGAIVVGIIGAFIGGWLFGQMGVSAGAGLVGAIVTATIGAVVLLAVLRMARASSL
ncbi:MAG: GlsB/YeaQ/YmgE family stress response membrane protein [Alphaproteobacteria bacterium]|nr:GlsB/YeaQ/YmgE family stress response membrane protein [Alphaproteobacteria bacterium]